MRQCHAFLSVISASNSRQQSAIFSRCLKSVFCWRMGLSVWSDLVLDYTRFTVRASSVLSIRWKGWADLVEARIRNGDAAAKLFCCSSFSWPHRLWPALFCTRATFGLMVWKWMQIWDRRLVGLSPPVIEEHCYALAHDLSDKIWISVYRLCSWTTPFPIGPYGGKVAWFPATWQSVRYDIISR